MHLFTYLIFIAYPMFTLCQSPLPSTNLSPHKPESCKWTKNDCTDLKTHPDFYTNCAEDGDGGVFSCFVECRPKKRPTGDRCENYCEKYERHCNGKLSVTTTTPATPTATVGYTQAPAYRPKNCKWSREDCRNMNWKTDPDFETNCAEDGGEEIFSCSVECEERPTGDRYYNYCKMFQEDCKCKDSLDATTETPENHEHDCECPEREDHPCWVWIVFTALFGAIIAILCAGFAIAAICGCIVFNWKYKYKKRPPMSSSGSSSSESSSRM